MTVNPGVMVSARKFSLDGKLQFIPRKMSFLETSAYECNFLGEQLLYSNYTHVPHKSRGLFM